jgi:hypothetical protein
MVALPQRADEPGVFKGGRSAAAWRQFRTTDRQPDARPSVAERRSPSDGDDFSKTDLAPGGVQVRSRGTWALAPRVGVRQLLSALRHFDEREIISEGTIAKSERER